MHIANLSAPRPGTRFWADCASLFQLSLRDKVLPYWAKTLDRVNGGYIVADRQRNLRARLRDIAHRTGAPHTEEKLIISQARLLYVFSRAHRLGYSDSKRSYLSFAERGYRFLIDFLFDKARGAFNWKVDLAGRTLDDRKFLYGQSIAIYALTEYYRASGLTEPLDCARQVFETVDRHMRDEKHSGWWEHTAEDFTPFEYKGEPPNTDIPGVIGLKSGDALMHWMEALSELHAATGDARVRLRLEETLKINREVFFPSDLERSQRFCTPDWEGMRGGFYDEISYGHNLEFAWLMIRAQTVLETPCDWNHFDALVTNCLEFGFDHMRGGFYYHGPVNQLAHATEKVWWVQAEGLAALSDALRHGPKPNYERALAKLLRWILSFQMLPDGIWICSTDAAGHWVNFMKAGNWKAGYHEVRAMTKYIASISEKESYDRTE
jgi:mannose/cellobiose epimerase-like protein (N-acyl-D-glucosamine 2-epimerase family)